MKINWKAKLTSRKFWSAVAGFIAPMLYAFGVSESATGEIVSIIMAGAVLIAYIVGEGLVDAARDDTEATYEAGYKDGFEDGYSESGDE